MSKELIENLRSVGRLWEDQAADRIEELERVRDALQADNARLREALIGYHSVASGVLGVPSIAECAKKASSALATTPEQSLARVRNQVREECAVELDGHWDMAAGIIRAMKE